MPRNPNATSPNAKTAGAIMMSCRAVRELRADQISDRHQQAIITPPIQKPLKLPAVRPDRTFSDAPPSRLAVTISRTCRECVEVKTVIISGIIAPAAVPQLMIDASFHHIVVSPAKFGDQQP